MRERNCSPFVLQRAILRTAPSQLGQELSPESCVSQERQRTRWWSAGPQPHKPFSPESKLLAVYTPPQP